MNNYCGFILSFALLWIVNVLDYNQNISYNYEKETDLYILKSNSDNILKKLNTDLLNQDEKFYIFKDEANKEYKLVTWSTNEHYKYVDKDWFYVDPNIAIWKTYIREFEKKIDILRYDIKPPEIEDLIFQYDATNTDWSYNSTLSWPDYEISQWEDLSWRWNHAYQNTNSKKPKLDLNWINFLPVVRFDWWDILAVDDSVDINVAPTYKERSISIVYRTWTDVISNQMIYEEWWIDRWYSFMVHDWNIYAGIWNETERDTWHKYKSVDLWEALPESVYFIMIVQDSTNLDYNLNSLKIYLNWNLANSTSYVEQQYNHPNDIWIWWIRQNTVYPFSPWTNRNLSEWEYLIEWWIWELLSWNHALSETEVKWIQNYFNQKWLWGKKSIRYDIVNSTLKEFKEY